MTRIDFYVLSSGGAQHRGVFACRLAEKAVGQGMNIYVHTSGPGETSQLDELLWTFRDGSFLAHLTVEEAKRADPEGLTRILIGHEGCPDNLDGLLINLDSDVPQFFSRFERLAEIVGDDDAARHDARERYRFYRDRGYQLNSHTL